MIKRDVDTDALMQREKENLCPIPASRENISNFVTDNQYFRKKSEEEDEYARNERKKRLYADVVNSTDVNNINLSVTYLDILKSKKKQFL